ncbi:Glu-tRNA(Gln) amidotransferase subunit GatE [Candidatus Woesearchaeota archaeon]|nr:Glu-tRNA(Gln) amidotransferase subunit GatE [Candidatus Woesearchaeota archaeon]
MQHTQENESLGIRIGLEIHQQLNIGKLFCSCNPETAEDAQPDLIVTRRLRAAAGEEGEIDIAAMHEMQRDRLFIYHAYRNSTCAVELDEEPIHNLSHESLQAALQAAKALKATPVDKAYVMRKTVVDGSNTSGFQRTALIARNGEITTKKTHITIPTICIEEESAKIIETAQDSVIYSLSRLGIPLIEVATGPDITSPEQAREVAEHIGMVLRSTGKAKRGIGTIRQDINVSIAGGTRVEIKGAQELKLLPKLAQTEAQRQKKLLSISAELKKRGAEATGKATDITGIIKNSEPGFVKSQIEKGSEAVATKLEGFAEIIGTEIQPGRRLGKEFSEHARTTGAGGAIHSDELPAHGITQPQVDEIKRKLSCSQKDAFIIVIANKEQAEKAIKAITRRAHQAIQGVPSEVRKANPDGTTTYLRPMPGSARMYPETDTTPIIPETEGIEAPELMTEKQAKYEKMGLSKDIAQQISRTSFAQFEQYTAKYTRVDPYFIATTLLTTEKEIRRRYSITPDITSHDYEQVLNSLNNDTISREAVFEILLEKAKGKPLVEATKKYAKLTEHELNNAIKEIISQNKGMPTNALIGKAMEKLRGKAPGQKIAELVKRSTQQ